MPDGGQNTGRGDFRWMLIAAATLVAEAPSKQSPWAEVESAVLAAAGASGGTGASLVVDDVFCDCLAGLWEGGWQPAEVVRALRRRRGQLHADLAVTAMASERTRWSAPAPAEWSEQLHELGAHRPWWGDGRDWLVTWEQRHDVAWSDGLRICVETLACLMGLPRVEVLIPPPSKWSFGHFLGRRSSNHVDEQVLAKVRALLAKAESTTFEHEADALTAKAQELMARHLIDEAVARSAEAGPRQSPSATRVAVDDPYANAKSSLLAVVAVANGVRAVWDEAFAQMTLIGFEADLEGVQVLFTSLLMQASKAILLQGAVTDYRGRSRTRSFRQSFYLAFSQRIHERLQQATHQARCDAESDLGVDLLPVLAGRKDEVDDATQRMFPRLRRSRVSSVSNGDGWRAGRAAAEVASLGPVRPTLDASAK